MLETILGTLPVLFFSELFSDINIVLKIFVLLAIYGFITQHLGKGPVSILIMVAMGYFILFDYWKFFGGIYVLYIMILLGIGGVVIDFMFITPNAQGNTPISNGKDFMSRQAQFSRRGR